MATGNLLPALRGMFVPFLLFIFTTVYLLDALKLGSPIRYGVPSAAFMPIVLSVAMYAVIALITFQQLRLLWRRDLALSAEARPPLSDLIVPGLVVVSTALYVFLFTSLGFAISTLVYVYVLLGLFGYGDGRRLAGHGRRALAGIVITVAVYLFFVTAFGVQLPVLEGAF